MARPDAHRTCHGVFVVGLGICEATKLAWSRYHHNGYGYWWVRWDGFSHGFGGALGAFLDALSAMAVTVFLMEVGVRLCARWLRDPTLVLAIHCLAVAVAVACGAADMVLFIVVGGARLSLPLVLFAVSEMFYVLRALSPWLHVVGLATVCMALALVVIGHLVNAIQRALPAHKLSWHVCSGSVAVCLARLSYRCSGDHADGSGADMLSQFYVDGTAMFREVMSRATPEDMLETHNVVVKGNFTNSTFHPPLLLFHLEAGRLGLVSHAPGFNESATPFLRSLGTRYDVISVPGIVTVPTTLKGAWEALCGMPPAFTSDFREHGSALREQCLPRVLARCCGYYSILAKTDGQLNDMPLRVFGFDEVLFSEDSKELLARLEHRLEYLGGLRGQRPIFVYFYEAGPHVPYTSNRVNASERGYSSDPTEDVFLALHRRADTTAEALARFWPPKPADGTTWRKEHGAVIYFGDHGEVLERGAPPHGHLVSPEVTEVIMLFEQRAFARPNIGNGVRRFADMYSTIVDLCGLQAPGQLHIGKSLFEEGHRQVSSFSFYRPAEVVAVSFVEDACVYFAEFEYSTSRWRLVTQNLTRACFRGAKSIRMDSLRSLADDKLHQALNFRRQVNQIVTHSNVHAASWMVARFVRALGQAPEVIRNALRGGPLPSVTDTA